MDQSVLYLQNKKVFLKVKLLLVETGVWRWMPGFVNTAVMNYTGNDAPFGLVHAGLQIGPYIIDWTSYGLITPHRLKSTSPILLADINDDKESSIEMDEETILKICDKIVEWNVERSYSRFASPDKKEFNCQRLVIELLEVLGLPTKFGGPLGTFLDEMNGNGTMKMQYKDPSNNSVVSFQTHEELDEFLYKKVGKGTIASWRAKHSDEWKLLKGFDRAFWLMISFTPSEKWPKEHKPCSKGCPFNLVKQNPRNPVDIPELENKLEKLKETKNVGKDEVSYLEEQKEKLKNSLDNLQKVTSAENSLSEDDFIMLGALTGTLLDVEDALQQLKKLPLH